MRLIFSVLFCLLLPAAPGRALQTPQSASSEDAPSTSALLQPSLDALAKAVGSVKVEKWKGSSVRAEAGPNLQSIQKDLQTTLPVLLNTADAGPNSTTHLLPVLSNVDALYDVVLRVVDAAHTAAPAEQANQLRAALANLEQARRALQDRLMAAASFQEKQIVDLQAAAKSQPPPSACPTVPVTDGSKATPKKKPVPKKKPAAPTAQPAKPNQ